MRNTGISWAQDTWNPVRGCSRKSEGCRNCYAEGMAARFSGPGQPYEGLARFHGSDPFEHKRGEPRWTGEVRMIHERLADPIRWQKPRLIFVNSMSDLFHERLSNEEIAAIFGVMDAASRHTFQVLTKRPERMLKWFKWLDDQCGNIAVRRLDLLALAANDNGVSEVLKTRHPDNTTWPLKNVWLGVSVEDQKTADERIPLLLRCPAAVHWASYEPAIGPVDFSRFLARGSSCECDPNVDPNPRDRCTEDMIRCHAGCRRLDWAVVGGESGSNARPFDIDWARTTVKQFRAAGRPVFVKQMGASPHFEQMPIKFKHRSGADMMEWSEDLRVQEWPNR